MNSYYMVRYKAKDQPVVSPAANDQWNATTVKVHWSAAISLKSLAQKWKRLNGRRHVAFQTNPIRYISPKCLLFHILIVYEYRKYYLVHNNTTVCWNVSPLDQGLYKILLLCLVVCLNFREEVSSKITLYHSIVYARKNGCISMEWFQTIYITDSFYILDKYPVYLKLHWRICYKIVDL